MKRFIIGIVIAALGATAGIYIYKNKTLREQAEQYKVQLSELKTKLDSYGTNVTVYTVTREVKSGEIFDNSVIQELELPSAMMTDAYITDLTELENKYFLVDVKPNTPLVKDLFRNDFVAKDDRYVDIVADEYPVERRVGEFYDLRYQDQSGRDYIVLSKKRLNADYGSVFNVILNEKELQLYNSALIDRWHDPNSTLYFTKYVEPSLQEEAIEYYAPRTEILNILETNPNKVKIAKEEMIARRHAIDTGLDLPDKKDYKNPAEFFEKVGVGRLWRQGLIQEATPPNAEGKDSISDEVVTDDEYVDPYENINYNDVPPPGSESVGEEGAIGSANKGAGNTVEINP